MRRHSWIRRLVKDFEHNPKAQFRFHAVMMRFWELNLIAGLCLMLLAPGAWLRIGVFYVFVLSIYANWDTDLDSLAASMAALHSQAAEEQLAHPPKEAS